MNPQKSVLRTTALTAAVVTAIISVGLMFRACRFNQSGIALALIVLWILSPMLFLASIDVVARRWPNFRRTTVHWLLLAVASGSVIVYGIDLLMPLSLRAGFPFALVPGLSWLLIVMVLLLTAILRRIRRGNEPI